MKKSELSAVIKLVRHMQGLQRQITKPTTEDATDEEVEQLLQMLWEWMPRPNQPFPGKHTIENLVALMRGAENNNGYAYISRGDVARIIRNMAEKNALGSPMSVYLNKNYAEMTDDELYDNGRWNYRPTSLVKTLFDLHCNPHLFGHID